MKSPKPPPAPDPVATSRAQTASNIATATAQQNMNMVDQYTPEGNVIYREIGKITQPDGLGGTMTVPRFSATQTYSPEQQALYDLSTKTEQRIGEIGFNQAGRIGDLLGAPVKLGNEATEARLYDLGSRRLDPQFARQEEALRTRLANSGIRAGSAAYDAEMSNFNQGRNDAYNQLMLTGRGQAVQEQLTERNQPINEITALLNGSQVSQPNFINAPNTSVAGTDYLGAVRDKYAGEMAAYQQRMSAHNAMMGGLFSLAGDVAGAGIKKYSDRRLKSDIARIGTHRLGIGIYEYTIFGRREQGVMADEVKAVMPEAVTRHENGFDMVDYGALA